METQPWALRLLHWTNTILLAVMAGSGLRIFAAFPSFGPRGEPAGWYPWHGKPPPDALTIGGWLAGARAYHFAFAWLFVANGLAYVLYLAVTGEYRRRLFSPRRDTLGALQMVGYYLRLGRKGEPPESDLYNPLQRFAYTSALLFGVASIVTGLVLYKPLQLAFFGYETARALHFFALVAFGLFTVAHVTMVLLHPRTIRAITLGS
ncbi:MAG: cytochrome b/b6 domain-containing protein [Polyangiales bacterium]